MPYTIKEIAALLNTTCCGEEQNSITRLLTDSRSVCFPEETLFFALKSNRNDGHRYISELYDKGVRAFVVSELPPKADTQKGASFLKVASPLKALQLLAERHRDKFNMPLIGITGSNGKTIVKEWIYKLTNKERTVTRSPRSYNSQIGVPLSIWQLNEQTELAVIEVGISEPLEMQRLQPIVKPTIGIMTNLGGSHQENFSTLQEKCIEKLKLFKDCEVIIYNADSHIIHDCISNGEFQAKTIAWSTADEQSELYISAIEKAEQETLVRYRYFSTEGEYRIPFIDNAAIENSINTLAACLYLGMAPATIAERMRSLEPVAMRMEVKEGKQGCTLINDSYNSDPASLEIALDFMARRPEKEGKKRTLILSDMMETGVPARELYCHVAEMMKQKGIEKFIGVGKEIAKVADVFPFEKYFFTTTSELLASEVFDSLRSEMILIKGARCFHFDDLTEQLELKVHETILEIDLNAVIDNYNYYRGMTKPGTKMICMVKAAAYGAGSYEIAKTLQDHRVDYLAVAVADEGVELRKAGITCPIIIMNPEVTAFKHMFDYHLEPEVYSFRLLDKLIEAAEKEGIDNHPIHIKVDSGMHRLGFLPEEMPALVERLKRQNAATPRSVFSHFVGSDSNRFDAFSELQWERFRRAAETLQEAFSHKILRHICNSAGIERFPEYHLDMVRLGLGLYGVDPIDNRLLNPVSTLKTTILQIHDVQPGETIGYSRRGEVKQPSRIAALPIGYADGLNRKLGNGNAYCIVNGKKAPYIGNICMDVCMIDVTGIECNEGDTAIIFGKELPVTVLSDTLQTIPYEVLTGVSNRVKRIYFQD